MNGKHLSECLQRLDDARDTLDRIGTDLRGAQEFRDAVFNLLEGTPFGAQSDIQHDGLYGRVRAALKASASPSNDGARQPQGLALKSAYIEGFNAARDTDGESAFEAWLHSAAKLDAVRVGESQGWYPIETASRDDTEIEMWGEDGIDIGNWQNAQPDELESGVIVEPGMDAGFYGCKGYWPGGNQPTHWRLPVGPAAASDDGAARPQPAQDDILWRVERMIEDTRHQMTLGTPLEREFFRGFNAAYHNVRNMLKEAALSSPSVADSPTDIPEQLKDWRIDHRGDLVACAKLLRKVPTLNEAVDILAKVLKASPPSPPAGADQTKNEER